MKLDYIEIGFSTETGQRDFIFCTGWKFSTDTLQIVILGLCFSHNISKVKRTLVGYTYESFCMTSYQF